MIPLSHPLIDVFLLGVIATASFVAALFFLRFWRSTKDMLFLAFAIFFVVEGGSHAFVVTLSHPNEGSVWLFVLRLLSILPLLGAILWKNFSRS